MATQHMNQFTHRDKKFRLKSVISPALLGALVLIVPVSASAQDVPAGPLVNGAAKAPGAPEGENDPQAQREEDARTIFRLQNRVKDLESQIADLRAMVGTFSSMSQGGNRSGFASSNARPGDARVRAGGGALPWQGNDSNEEAGDPQGPAGDQGYQDPQNSRNTAGPSPVYGPAAAPPAATERPDTGEDGYRPARGSAGQNKEVKRASAGLAPRPAPGPENSDAQTLYQNAYGHMLRRDYASAETAFGALIKNHPQSRMAGNAQYWLGETYYVRGKYRPAADAFLKAYRNYSNSVKAPDSLMKLALSLTRLGQKSAACKTFAELDAKYPNAPGHVRQRAGMESRRAGCN